MLPIDWTYKTMDFGKHKGTRIRDLPLDYCLWALSQCWMREKFPRHCRGFAVVVRKHFADGDPYDPADLI